MMAQISHCYSVYLGWGKCHSVIKFTEISFLPEAGFHKRRWGLVVFKYCSNNNYYYYIMCKLCCILVTNPGHKVYLPITLMCNTCYLRGFFQARLHFPRHISVKALITSWWNNNVQDQYCHKLKRHVFTASHLVELLTFPCMVEVWDFPSHFNTVGVFYWPSGQASTRCLEDISHYLGFISFLLTS